MAISKQVKVGGSYYKGERLIVDSTPGDYVIYSAISSGGSAVNSMSLSPQKKGNLDTMAIHHVDGTSAGSKVVAVIAEKIYNRGAGVNINLDFIALEKMDIGHSMKTIYTNTSSVAMDVFILVERGR